MTQSLIARTTPRTIIFTPNINPYALGSVLVEFGQTKVQVTVMLQESVPPFLRNKGIGWVTSEYSMLPASSKDRIERERKGASGRTQEIQRLIGRSLRSIIDTSKMGERTLMVDCDVLVADGGTRTASISGAYVAMAIAERKLLQQGLIKNSILKDSLSALSVGINKQGQVIADLNYVEDSSCETDMNIVMTGSGKFVEVQGTAEGEAFSREALNALLDCATEAMKVVRHKQLEAIELAFKG